MSDPVLPWGSLDPEQLLEGTSVGEWKVGKSGGPYVYCEGRAVCIIDEWPDVAEPNCRRWVGEGLLNGVSVEKVRAWGYFVKVKP
jgi:hypothetical protein